MVLCCALALQPSLIVSGRAGARGMTTRTRVTGTAGGSLAFIAQSLLTAAAGIGDGARRLLLPREERGGNYAGDGNTIEPEPAAAAVVFLGAPDGISVVSTSDSQITLNWAAVAGAVAYRVERSPNVLSPYSTVGEPASQGFQDSGVSRGYTYLYRVRAISAEGTLSPPSAVAMATAITFLDTELVGAGDPQGRPSTKIKAPHVNDLRLAVAGVRRAAGLSAASWGETVSAGVLVRAAHMRELRDKLDEGLSALGLTTSSYTDSTLNTGPAGTRIKKTHVEELRARATRGSGVNGSGLAAYDFAAARLDPSNRTGGSGVDILSRNFNWSLPVVSLPGRSGLDLGLSLSHNSLVWTKSGDYMLFDGDWGWPAPGFRLGFPVIQGMFYDTQAQKAAYMLVMPSGARVSLRRTATPTVYEAGDSSYLQLTQEADGRLTLVAPGGTRMTYWLLGGAYKCTEVKDRHGNVITAEYNGYGNLEKVTDTLGREIAFGYYPDGYLKEITQVWHREVESNGGVQTVTETHRWAKFEYADTQVRTNFPGLTVFGPTGGQTFHALKKVTLADGSYLTFNYTTWGQVNQVATYAPNNGLLNYVSLNLPADESQPQADCPRPTQRREWAAYWNGDEDGVGAASEEAVTGYTVTAGQPWQDPETGQQQVGTLARQTTPDGVVYQEYSHASGWEKGLPRLSEVWSGDRREKWSSSLWTQDNEGLGYEQNPRLREVNVYDPKEDGTVRNHRRTEITYTAFGLPEDVKEYDATATAVLRRTHTEYVPASVNAGGAYVAKRIIGLPSKHELYGLEEGAEKLYSKITYEYDLGGEFLETPEGGAAAVPQHDGANFGVGLVTRGALCRTRRWDVGDRDNQSKSVASESGRNTLGSVVFTRDAHGHQTRISYADSDGGARRAYPTTFTDPGGFTSSTWYNYDMGVVTKAETPKPNVTTDQPGPEFTRLYDSAGRVLKVKSLANGAYVRREYGASGLYAKQSMQVDSDQPETFLMTVTDGAGRVRGVLNLLPQGYSAQRSTVDKMGRPVRQYSPIRVSPAASDLSNIAAWQPSAEDALSNGGTGWVYSSTQYDWKGRPVLVTNLGSPATTKEASYDGCGCAGGETVLTRDEVGRRSKVTLDVLGRVVKAQDLDVQGKELPLTDEGGIYRTTLSAYNALDQITESSTFAGAAESDPTKIVKATVSYDGHGRAKSSHAPGQEAGRDTTYTYNADDMVESATDARGAKAVYVYNSRHLLESVDYQLTDVISGQDVAESPDVTFAYDAAGNRKSMAMQTAAGPQGGVSYTYDELSKLVTEARQFPGLAGTYTLSYAYTLAGGLKSVTDQSNPSSPVGFSYGFDAAGRVTGVGSTGMGATAPLVSNAEYHAWGAPKLVEYGDTTSAVLSYDARGLVKGYTLGGAKDRTTGAARSEGGEFQRYADGRVKYATNYLSRSVGSGALDRAYSYDLVGRLKEAYSGADARAFAGDPASGSADVPYRQSYSHDVWDNQRNRTGHFWGQDDTTPVGFDPVAGHNPDWLHDADGRLVSRNEESPNGLSYQPARFKYNAAGQRAETTQTSTQQFTTSSVKTTAVTVTDTYDGDGAGVRQVKVTQFNSNAPTNSTTYYLRSSVLGGSLVAEYNAAGARKVSYAYAGGQLLAVERGADSTSPSLRWQHVDPVTGDSRETDGAGKVIAETHVDPVGVNVGLTSPLSEGGTGDSSEVMGQAAVDRMAAWLLPGYGGPKCKVDFAVTSCALAAGVESSGAGVRVGGDSESGKFIKFTNATNGQSTYRWSPLTAVGESAAYVPLGSRIVGQNTLVINLSEISVRGRNPYAEASLSNAPFAAQFGGFPVLANRGWGARSLSEGGRGGSRLTPAQRKAVEKALTTCLRNRGFHLLAFDPAGKGKNGKITVMQSGSEVDGASPETVTNDATTYNESWLIVKYDRDHTSYPGAYSYPGAFLKDHEHLYGYTERKTGLTFTPSDRDTIPNNPNNPNTKYNATLLGFDGGFVESQIHELAHALGVLYKKNGAAYDTKESGDAGHELVRCVSDELKKR
jgi:YD repeat-containing protein